MHHPATPPDISVSQWLILIAVSAGAGIASFARELWKDICGLEPKPTAPGVVFIFGRRIKLARLVLRATVKIMGAIGAGVTAAFGVHAMGFHPSWEIVAASLAGTMGWRFFDFWSAEAVAAIREKLGTEHRRDDKWP